MDHQLNWTPGQYGKGVVMPDGTLHHWNTNGPFKDGNPTHRQYVQEIGKGDIYTDPKRFDAHTRFWIEPDGRYEILNNTDNAHIIESVDPRLKTHEGDWRFGDNRSQQRVLDPVGFEREHDWDQSLKYDHPEETEWVPTEHLKQFMEFDRRPGQPESYSSPERWNALTEHIKEHGLGSPVILDYNPDTNMAHMSEGNHRTQIALDNGIPALPVRVYRSRRTSPVQVPVNGQPQPEWEDRHDPLGYHWPTNIRPSHIGLPTVPAPGHEPDTNWTLGKTASRIRIVQGQTEPKDSDWAFTDRSDSHMPMLYDEELGPTVYIGKGGTHHSDLINEFGLQPRAIHAWGYLDTDGFHDSSESFPKEALAAAMDYVGEQHGTDFGRDEPAEDWTFE